MSNTRLFRKVATSNWVYYNHQNKFIKNMYSQAPVSKYSDVADWVPQKDMELELVSQDKYIAMF